MILELGKIKKYIDKFSHSRDWVSFYSPKNLSMALNT